MVPQTPPHDLASRWEVLVVSPPDWLEGRGWRSHLGYLSIVVTALIPSVLLVAWLGVGDGVWRLPLIALATGLIAVPFVSLLPH